MRLSLCIQQPCCAVLCRACRVRCVHACWALLMQGLSLEAEDYTAHLEAWHASEEGRRWLGGQAAAGLTLRELAAEDDEAVEAMWEEEGAEP